mgnify:CR=1 FL=1
MTIFLDGPGITGAITVGTSPVEAKIGASPLSERKSIILQPLDGDIYWSYDSGVTTSTGHALDEGSLIYIQTGELLPVYLIAASNTDVRISEVA